MCQIITKQMFGFLNKHDINQPIIHFLDKIYSALNKDVSEYTLGTFLDLKKAFDTVVKSILLRNMLLLFLLYRNDLPNATDFFTSR